MLDYVIVPPHSLNLTRSVTRITSCYSLCPPSVKGPFRRLLSVLGNSVATRLKVLCLLPLIGPNPNVFVEGVRSHLGNASLLDPILNASQLRQSFPGVHEARRRFAKRLFQAVAPCILGNTEATPAYIDLW